MTRAQHEFDVTQHFDESLSTQYDRRIRLFCPSYDALHQMLIPWLQELPKNANFLSAGAGTGAEIVNLGKVFSNWNFVAVDASGDMLNACHQRIKSVEMGNRVTLVNSKVQDYKFPGGFDGASSIFVAHFIRDKQEKLAYFSSLASNLKPGAILAIADLFGNRETLEFSRLLNALLMSYAGHGISEEQFDRDREHIERDVDFISESELFSLLNQAGFIKPLKFYQTYLFGGWIATRSG
ncbi:methyltransferase domain-containing protein [Roseofilum reptotaenium CS-1145]|uniref:Methyltransferase type 12 n=1 Tax=Roseofilum reptotaenium AO1-A TaxID=1925591 RepID=A0A1L9QNK6_9CYAN|nr:MULTISPECIES: class I SAM-dependent methyltransferase [Roseofilum]MBP0030007.1 methyltransferase domain-containing protein [Roseofilum sp. Guam]MDB9517560.1 methyltransferase domain-containing protein [Roseofilum reptotaenium CS-1145]OJJ24251.1 methyltransferase type 12 [Roseofilum reptotaenium AO1-A]